MRHVSFFLLLSLLIASETIKASTIDTPASEKHYTKKQLDDDVKYLVNTIADVHPNMYHSISQKHYQRLTDSVMALLHNGMTGKQAWPLLAQLVGALNEGHSVFNFPDDLTATLKSGNSILFPISIREFDGEYLIVRADGSAEDVLLPGDKIVSINGIQASKLIDNLSLHMGGLKLWRANDVCRNLIAYINIYGINAPYHFKYLRGNKIDSVVLKPVSFANYVSRLKAKAATLPKVTKPADYTLEYLDNGKAYLRINSLTEDPAKFKHFLDSAFTRLKQSTPGTLIIDLRRNGGGNSALAETLLSFITDKPFRMAGGVKWKVSQEYKDQLKARLKGDDSQKMDYYFNGTNGSILESKGDNPEKPAKNSLLFKGKVVVLIGPKTFSSANMLANTIQDYKLASLIGEPTGEPANDYGELINIKLPNTGFSFSTSTKQFIRANGDSKDSNSVLPDNKVVDDPVTSKDEVLEFAKKM